MPALIDLDVEFVSLVDRASVRDPVNQSEPMRLLVWKRDTNQGDSMTPEEMQAALTKAQDQAKKADAELETVKADLTKSQTDAADLAARLKALEDGKKNETEKAEEIDKSELPEPVRAALEKAEADRKEMADRLEKAEDIAKAEREERLTRDFVAKAEAFKALPIKKAEFGPVLKAAAEKLTKDEYAALETVLKAADAQITATDLFKEQGRAGEATKADTAIAEATQKAQEIRKADTSLTSAQALKKAFAADPVLAARYQDELRAR